MTIPSPWFYTLLVLVTMVGVRIEVDFNQTSADAGSELERAVEMCEEEREPQLFSHLVAQYMARARHREDLLRGALGKYCVARYTRHLAHLDTWHTGTPGHLDTWTHGHIDT